MNMAIEQLEKLPLSERLIKEIHMVLLTNSRGKGKDPGNFRTGNVFIGKQTLGLVGATYVPPEPQLISEYFSNFEKYIHYEEEKDEIVQLAIVHSQFEIIHPFWDGNGRTGRILMPLFLYYKKVLSSPCFI